MTKQPTKFTPRTANLVLLVLLAVALNACEEHFTPKPRGYFRIELPEKDYKTYEARCGLQVEVPAYSRIELLSENPDSCWFNIYMPRQKARLHLTYVPVENNLQPLLEDAYGFAFKHEMKANAINRTVYQNDSTQVYGMLYDLKGDVASPLQFYVTDSSRHFLRGAVYFQHIPNADSIAPVLEFVRADALHLIETLRWQTERL